MGDCGGAVAVGVRAGGGIRFLFFGLGPRFAPVGRGGGFTGCSGDAGDWTGDAFNRALVRGGSEGGSNLRFPSLAFAPVGSGEGVVYTGEAGDSIGVGD